MPEVSVIVNCFNGERHLREALDSAFSQTFDDWEIIFWDNASTDASAEIAKSYGERVRYFRSESTVHLGRARNWAFQQTRGSYVAMLDSDDIWLPHKLERQLELIRSDQELGMVYCDSICFDSQGEQYRQFQVSTPRRGHAFASFLRDDFNPFTSSIIYRKDAMEQLDYVFGDQYARIQDYDLCLRMMYQFPIDYVSEPLCGFRLYQDSPEWQAWKKSLGPRVLERKMVIDHLLATRPVIKSKYPRELAVCYKWLDYALGLNAWQSGDVAGARSYLSQRLTDKKLAFVYLCTFLFSETAFSKLKDKYKGARSRLSQKMAPVLRGRLRDSKEFGADD